MPFPESPRVVYARNPIREVICQLRYPAILRIEAEVPARYQETIRDRFPTYEKRKASPPMLPDSAPPALHQFLTQADAPTLHVFQSADGLVTVTMSQEHISVTVGSYDNWPTFRSLLEQVLTPFIQEYTPPFISRLGLRYIDAIQRSQLSLDDRPWGELLATPIAGELADGSVGGSIVQASKELTFALHGVEGKATLRHGLATQPGLEEALYLIDADFYSDTRTEKDDIYERLDAYNKKAGHLFRWCISPVLARALNQPLG